MKRTVILTCVFSACATHVHAQLDSIMDQGAYRTFITHLPSGYDANVDYPLVFDLHGLNSNAAQQELYSAFDPIADTAGFILVYPNAMDGPWNLLNTTDVDFLTHLVDTARARYSTNTCLLFTGMSMGGFMTYKMACSGPLPLTAIAVVSGNMTTALQNNCPVPPGLPVLHFHGTEDVIVNYNGTFGIPPVESTIQWWVTRNACDAIPQTTAIPNTVIADSCTVDRFRYMNGVNGSEVAFYRINDGGHTWPGAVPVPPLGYTDQDINASAIIWNFFRERCEMISTDVASSTSFTFALLPNPATDHMSIRIPERMAGDQMDVEIVDVRGSVLIKTMFVGALQDISITSLAPGIYIVRLSSKGLTTEQRLVIVRDPR